MTSKLNWADNPVFSVTWSFTIILICWFGAHETWAYYYEFFDSLYRNIFVETDTHIQLKSKVDIHLAKSAKCWLFYQVRGIIQMHAIVYLVLAWIIYFTLKMFTCSPQENIIVEFIKITPVQKVYIRLILNTVLLPEWSTISNIWFSSIFVYLNNDCDFETHLLHLYKPRD